MQFFIKASALAILLTLCGAAEAAPPFKLSSPDVITGQKMTMAQVANVFGCSGGNISPALAWTGAPAGTKSFVLTAYDPDAPTGSGFWHWSIANIAASVSNLPAGLEADKGPPGSIQVRNDYGLIGFGGACPPPGPPHRYTFTIYALGVEKIDVNVGTTPAVVGFMTQANTIGKASITAYYQR